MKECKYVKFCGGCNGVEREYSLTLEDKTKTIRDMFVDIAEVENTIGNFYPLKYRNKLQLAFHELKGKTLIGFFEENSTRVVDIDGCILNGDYAGILISILREYISRFKLRAFMPNRSGVLRYAHARCIENNLQLTLVVTNMNFAGRDWLYKKLCEKFKSVSLYLNINNRTDRAIFGNSFKHIAGAKTLNFDFMGIKVQLYPSSFLQVNLDMAKTIYKKSLELLDIDKDTVVFDLYSGIGITSILFAKQCKKVISIEEVSSAVINAKNMAKINGVNNITHLCGKCEDIINSIKETDDLVVFVDPARAGIEKSILDAVKSLNPRKIVYMSCNPETCLRDIKYILSDSRYECNDIIPYDIFAYTNHVELLCDVKRIDK